MTAETPPAAVLAYLSRSARTDASGAVTFYDDDGNVILDTDAPGCPPADARAVAAWTRSHKPQLWGQPRPAASAPTASTAAAAMAAVKGGSMTASEATAALFANAAPVPSRAAVATDARAPAPTFSELMLAVRRGLPGAQDRLDAAISGAFR